ncbi:NAD-dependent epimerase dehydratase 3-beta hydroxysteroid dehydrogenase isomerase NmrA family protein [Levilactobacillus paucivorans]|uniref:NAD-dependent epimerase dehydratase 3-beta hydroxysteroid dehydrogenase isomerase NmrA family protein n=1 Tax=Levilactobacillus paucivorans TaxID=616990 RepID=A0A0R2M168_9LACO|nr:NAD(P)H-binding protein [Levilactobacillus paucivorans]KRO05520.1 NAD-dependent epimerase dehydratase 3-beta hydroxysteroid dehydrogenase isomerase NmrA family protein [Levilactobacillus paucivorans]
MKNVLILGASGSIATLVTRNLIEDSRVRLTLLVRNPDHLADDIRYDSRVTIVVADVVKDTAHLTAAMQGQDLVYANLYGANLKQQAQAVVSAMTTAKVTRIIWISANGIYNEIPGRYGQWNAQMLGSTLTAYAAGAKIIENSRLQYTLVRPAWFSDKDLVSYELTQKGQPFKGTEVSRQSVASYLSALILDPSQAINQSIGISEPHTDGSKPSFY